MGSPSVLAALDAEHVVPTQEQRFFCRCQGSRAHSRVRTTSTSLKQWRNCTFLPSMQRSLSLLRNTVQTLVSLAIAACGPPPLASAKKHQTFLVQACATTEHCWSFRLLFTCQWTPYILPVTVLLSSMTELSSTWYSCGGRWHFIPHKLTFRQLWKK